MKTERFAGGAAAEEVLLRIPDACKAVYVRAQSKQSMRSAVNAMCQHCMGYDNYAKEIRRCTDRACPLYAFRPYQVKQTRVAK